MTTKILISVEQGAKTLATMLTFERLDAAALAQVEDATHDLAALLERLERTQRDEAST